MLITLIAGTVFIIGTALSDERRNPKPSDSESDFYSSIPGERGVFSHADDAIKFKDMPESGKELESYYKNRAYPGAPPTIPHEVLIEDGIGAKSCLQCHGKGGYVSRFEAFAPITPHPEMINCKQCHVPQNSMDQFKASIWQKIGAERIHQSALEGSPPIIPHTLDMRSNCLSCHGGPSAPKEIRVSHPERINCRQCHVPKNENEVFTRPFQRSLNKTEPSNR